MVGRVLLFTGRADSHVTQFNPITDVHTLVKLILNHNHQLLINAV